MLDVGVSPVPSEYDTTDMAEGEMTPSTVRGPRLALPAVDDRTLDNALLSGCVAMNLSASERSVKDGLSDKASESPVWVLSNVRVVSQATRSVAYLV
jgi:hypothetical protein